MVAVTALITSISSIVLAIGNGKTMDKLVKANSIPYLQGGFSDITPEGSRVLSLDLLNHGVGPAHERSLRVSVGRRYVTSVEQLMIASLGPELGLKAFQSFQPIMVANKVPTRFIPADQSQLVFRLPRTPETEQYWDALAKHESSWNVEFCYCSVFDECWQVKSKWSEPAHINQCTPDKRLDFIP